MTADDRRPPLPPPAHPDLDTLADLHADALDPATAERVRAHASSCPRCAPVLAGLDGVRDELRALPTPRMPAAVAARLDATLADLRRGDLPDSRHTGAGRAGTAALSPEEAARRRAVREADQLALARSLRRHRLARTFGAVAAAVAVIAAGASLTAVVRSSTSTSDSGDSAAGSGADSATLSVPGAADPVAKNGATPSTAVGLPAYDRNSLRTALPSIAERSAVDIITGQGDTGPAGVMADTARRTACAGSIRGSRGELRAVLRIRYEGRPAYVFVFEDGSGRTGFVVSEDCGAGSGLPAAVLGTVS